MNGTQSGATPARQQKPAESTDIVKSSGCACRLNTPARPVVMVALTSIALAVPATQSAYATPSLCSCERTELTFVDKCSLQVSMHSPTGHGIFMVSFELVDEARIQTDLL